ncbi:hypothetical protein GC106_75770 [Kibdelosporangium sp. 4NS15]|uniref:Uncharacterized protein n=1 Tax=Kibdelosporangium persicum TaxID=2698649 RepID=A0ABX2FGA1_9PSEU|nr:hypothetical protein [Kibdelosporangium persicum]
MFEELRAAAGANPPRRFALCQILPGDGGFNGKIIAWGLAHEDKVQVNSVEPGMSGHLSSMDSVSFLFGDSCEVVWIDCEP